jgi:hypothetical protein
MGVRTWAFTVRGKNRLRVENRMQRGIFCVRENVKE